MSNEPSTRKTARGEARLTVMAWIARSASPLSEAQISGIRVSARTLECEAFVETLLANDWTLREDQLISAIEVLQNEDGYVNFLYDLFSDELYDSVGSSADLEATGWIESAFEEKKWVMKPRYNDYVSFNMLGQLITFKPDPTHRSSPSPSCLSGLEPVPRRLAIDEEVEWDLSFWDSLLGTLPDSHAIAMAARTALRSFPLAAAANLLWWDDDSRPLLLAETAANTLMVTALLVAQVEQAKAMGQNSFELEGVIQETITGLDTEWSKIPASSKTTGFAIQCALASALEDSETQKYAAMAVLNGWEITPYEDFRKLQRLECTLKEYLERPIWPDGLPASVLEDVPDDASEEVRSSIARMKALDKHFNWDDCLLIVPDELKQVVKPLL